MKWPWNRNKATSLDAGNTLYLFPDTNFFQQCHPADQIDWSCFADFDDVQLVVTRPVQKEIDGQKNRGRGRLGNRARKAASQFKQAVHAETKLIEISAANPRVILQLRIDLRAGNAPDGRLDLDEADDRLVAIAAEFARHHPQARVRLLTDDSGPTASASMVGLRIEPIPKSWLLPPESNESERRIRSLEAEVRRLKRNEPDFDIRFRVADSAKDSRLDLEIREYRPLTDDEQVQLTEELRQRYPLVTDFGPQERQTRTGQFGIKQVWQPAAAADIDANRERYAEWLDGVIAAIGSLPLVLAQSLEPASVDVMIENTGSRPAKDALVEIEARGNFWLYVPADSDKSSDTGLKAPPTEPAGRWVSSHNVLDQTLRDFARMEQVGLHHPGLGASIGESLGLSERLARIPAGPKTRDPNQFYYKPSRPTSASDAVTLECQQWRHGTAPEPFYVQVVMPVDETQVDGALEVRIHAENLSTVTKRTIPVRIKRCHLDPMLAVSACLADLGHNESGNDS